jgi:hypothetical protein
VKSRFLTLLDITASATFTKKKIMRKIIVTEFITLDGVIESPGGNETPHPHGG